MSISYLAAVSKSNEFIFLILGGPGSGRPGALSEAARVLWFVLDTQLSVVMLCVLGCVL